MPNIAEDYVHRIGRTGRAGASGEAISLVSHDEEEYIRAIEKLLGFKLARKTLKGFEQSSLEEVQEIEAELTKKHGGNNNRGGKGRPSNRRNQNSSNRRRS